MFEELGFNYFGPIDGHNIDELVSTLERIKVTKGPILLHVITQKGKGYEYAEKRPHLYHGITPFDIETGLTIQDARQKDYSKEIVKLINILDNPQNFVLNLRDLILKIFGFLFFLFSVFKIMETINISATSFLYLIEGNSVIWGLFFIFTSILYILFYVLYLNGVFIKEEYSGITIDSLFIGDNIVGNNIYIKLDNSSEYALKLSECENKNIQLKCSWEYEYKYYEKTTECPVVKYKQIEYTLLKDDVVYAQNEVNDTIFTAYGSCRKFTNFNFTIKEIGEYEVVINLFIAIGDKNYSQIRKFKIIVN